MNPLAPAVLVVDDQRTFPRLSSAVYARDIHTALRQLDEQPWDQLWLDYNLGLGLTIKPLVKRLVERAAAGQRPAIGAILLHSDSHAAKAELEEQLKAAGYHVGCVDPRYYETRLCYICSGSLFNELPLPPDSSSVHLRLLVCCMCEFELPL